AAPPPGRERQGLNDRRRGETRAHRVPARLDKAASAGAGILDSPQPPVAPKGGSPMLLDGKVAIVTGSGRGIGREEAFLLAKHGAKVGVNDLGAHFDGTGEPTATPAQDVVAEIKKMGGQAIANGDSVADFKAAKRIVQRALDTLRHTTL